MKTMSIKELLKEGRSAEDLIKDLEAEIEEAKRQIAADEEKLKEKRAEEEYLRACREDLAAVMMDYFVALDITKEEDVTDERLEKFTDNIKAIEPYLKGDNIRKIQFKNLDSLFKTWDRLL